MTTHAMQQERQPCAPNQPFSLFPTQVPHQFRTPPATPPQEQHKRNRGGGVMGVAMAQQQQHCHPQQQQQEQQCDELPVQQNSGKRSRSNKYIAPRETDRTSFAAVMGRSLINHYQQPLELRRQPSSTQLVQFLGNHDKMDEDPPQSGRERSMSF